MQEEARRKLDQVAGREHVRHRLAMGIGVLLALLLGVYLTYNRPTSERLVYGVAQRSVWRIDEDSGQRYPQLEVKLDDGRLIRAGTFQPDLPAAAERIALRERTWLSGGQTYIWEGPEKPEGKP